MVRVRVNAPPALREDEAHQVPFVGVLFRRHLSEPVVECGPEFIAGSGSSKAFAFASSSADRAGGVRTKLPYCRSWPGPAPVRRSFSDGRVGIGRATLCDGGAASSAESSAGSWGS